MIQTDTKKKIPRIVFNLIDYFSFASTFSPCILKFYLKFKQKFQYDTNCELDFKIGGVNPLLFLRSSVKLLFRIGRKRWHNVVTEWRKARCHEGCRSIHQPRRSRFRFPPLIWPDKEQRGSHWKLFGGA